MKKLTILRTILALGVSHTISYGMETSSGNRTSLESSWIDLQGGTVITPMKNKLVEVYKNLVLPIEMNQPSSGLDILSEGSQTTGTLAYEILEGDSKRIMQLCKLAAIPYCAEKGNNELAEDDAVMMQSLSKFNAKILSCKITEKEMDDSDFTDLMSKKKSELFALFKRYKNEGVLSIQTVGSSEMTMSCFAGYHDSIKQHLQTVDPLKLLDNKLEFLCGDFEKIDLTRIAFNQWICDVSKQVEIVIESYTNKFWHTQIQETIEKSYYLEGMDLTVLGTLSRNEINSEGQFSTVIAANKDYTKIYVLSAGTKTKEDWLWNNLNAPLTDKQPEKETLVGHQLHRGFYDAALGDDRFVELIKTILLQNKSKGLLCPEFYCIGHSLGGAIATIQGLVVQELIEKVLKEEQHSNCVKIFGVAAAMPAQANEKLEACIKKINLSNMIYVDDWNDPVPLAAQVVGYTTVGMHLVIPTNFLKALEFKDIPGLHNHYMKSYLNKIEEFYGYLKNGVESRKELKAQFEKYPTEVRLTESFFASNPVDFYGDAEKLDKANSDIRKANNYKDNPDEGSSTRKAFSVVTSVVGYALMPITYPATVIYNYATSSKVDDGDTDKIKNEKK